MTARRDPILTFALCASLVAHTAILLILAGQFVDSLPALSLGGIRGAKTAPPVVMVMRSPPPAPPSYLLFGDSHGLGDAANASPGEKPMQGRDGPQVQAFLSRDPVGPGDVGKDPSMSVLPRGAPPQPSAQQVAPAPPPTLKTIGVADSVQAWSKPRVARATPTPAPAHTPAPAAAAAPAHPPAPVGAELPPADPAIMSDSESDAFAKGNAIEFKDGRVDVRFGRKVKTVRPRLSLAATYDLMAMEGPRMVVRVSVDPSGNVRLVNIVKSTGSESADQAVKVALYQWWFEPPKDKSGKTQADVVEFPIVWR